MSSIKLTLKLFRHNLKSISAYLFTLMLTVAMYYDFALLKHSPEALGNPGAGTTMMVSAMLMSIVMLIVFFAFIWSSSRFFLTQRKKEIGLYALCGVPMARVGRVFLWDGLLTGLCALIGGLGLGALLTKLFLMGGAMMIQLEKPMAFTLSVPALTETCLIVLVIFLVVALRNAMTVRRSQLIELIQGMRVSETPPKRRTVLAVLSVLTLTAGYTMSLFLVNGFLVLLAIPVLLLVVMGTYWAFEALLPAVLEALTQKKNFFYRGMRMVGISNLWYRLHTNYRNLALTSVLSATAIVTLCTALSMSGYVGAREGKQVQRLYRAYSLTAWMDQDQQQDVLQAMEDLGIAPGKGFWMPVTRVLPADDGKGMAEMVMELSDAQVAADRVAKLVNLPQHKLQIGPGQALVLNSPEFIHSDPGDDPVIGGRSMRVTAQPDLWLWGSNSAASRVFVVPDGFLSQWPDTLKEPRVFLGLQIPDEQADELLAALNERAPGVAAMRNVALTTGARMLYGTLSYLGLIMFGVFSLLTGCALMFKQLSEAVADRPKYQAMWNIGATKKEIMSAICVQVGLSLVVPLLLGFVHAAFAVRVMGEMFVLATSGYLVLSSLIYALIVAALYGLTVNRFMRIVG